MILKEISYVANYLDEKLPSSGWVSLNDLFRYLVTDHGLRGIRLRGFVELCKQLGLGVRHEPGKNKDRWEFEVSRTPTGAAPKRSVPSTQFRRTFLQWLDRRVKPGEYYPTRTLYEEFRRAVNLPEVSTSQLSRALAGSEFEVTLRGTGSTRHRCVERRAQGPAPR